MTDEQRVQARKARDEYAAYLRGWEAYVRSREAYRPRENFTTKADNGEIISTCPFSMADLEKAAALYCDDFPHAENEAYQTFSKFFIGKPDVLKVFDELRDTVRKAYALSDQGLVPDKLADTLKNLAEAVEVFDFGTNSLEEIKQGIIQAVKEEHERTRQETGDTVREVVKDIKSKADKHAETTARALGSLKQGQEEIKQGQAALSEGQSEQNDFLIGIGKTVDGIDRNTRPDTPRPDDYEVTQQEAARILTDAGYKVSARQIQNWERHINTNGAEGTEPPKGYKIELRAGFLTFNVWAQDTASHKRMKKALRQRRQRAHKTNA